jgi:protein phosphatase
MRISAATDVGLRREHNEDSYAVWAPADAGERERRGDLLIVADGMGGSAAGEVASRTAVATVLDRFRAGEGDAGETLLHALEQAHVLVHHLSRTEPDMTGMGTTCTAVAIRGDRLWYAHVGDSRAYLLRGGQLRQLTADHSLVAQLVEQRIMSPEQARVDPRRNVLIRSMGVGEAIEVDHGSLEGRLLEGDTLLLCTDGLHGLVTDDEIVQRMDVPDLDHACSDLIALALERGGHDNVTVILARFSGGA